MATADSGKEEHKNIFEALAAFQGEMPEIKKTKRFGKEGDSMTFMYAPLDEFVSAVSPVTSRHGLAFTWEAAGKEDYIVCALYHTTYENKVLGYREIISGRSDTPETETIKEPVFQEVGVLRSLPMKVARSGDKKEVGKDSTYSRRYTLGEVLGVASEDDNDVGAEKARTKRLESFAFTKAKDSVQKAKTAEELAKNTKLFEKDLGAIEQGKTPSLGLKKEQYEELMQLVVSRLTDIERGLSATGDMTVVDDNAQVGAEEPGQQTIE